ncbi:hypothetical protein GCM10009677_01500 [Sphaerisporangium rubeum]|uniref:XRE family transcriptional regulator n=1 Tax=Sphaerisporangium rubeum TaxID=321317 RepID=A0A7X0M6C2_9ACTN|nr:hypothetical protein [Sphaerisporangium rubeum]MBB6473102.1 hypothetical protein [Sphaerisporangium rubeum]
MSGDGYRVLLECRRRSEALRGQGFGHDQIADIFALYHQATPLKLHRYAHGMTGSEVVAAYNDLDPAAGASLRECRLYVFESWPASDRRPSAQALTVFARIYRTKARRLITDEVYATYTVKDRELINRTDHSHLAPHPSRPVPAKKLSRASMDTEAPAEDEAYVITPSECGVLLSTLRTEEADVRRRDLLFELALALGGTPAVTLLRHLTPPEEDRLTRAVRGTGRVDTATVEVIEKLTARCRRLDDDFGPATVLSTVEAQRALVTGMLRHESALPAVRDRLIRARAQLDQMSGYIYNDLLDFPQARRRYHAALTAAQQISDVHLSAYVHVLLSRMADGRGRTGTALDHSFAAQGWARRGSSDLVRSVQSMELARMLARAGDAKESERALAHSTQLAGRSRGETDPLYLYWWTIDQVQSCASDCMLAWDRPDDAIAAAEQALTSPTMPKYLKGQTYVRYAQALTRKRDIPAAADKLRQAAHVGRAYNSGCLSRLIRQARTHLQPWERNKHIRDLDEELRVLGVTTTATA